MKNYLALFLLLCSAFGFAQSKSENVETIQKEKLNHVQLLSQLVTDISIDSTVSLEISVKVGGKVMVAKCTGNTLNKEVLDLLKNVDAGSKIYMDLYRDQKTDGKKKYWGVVGIQVAG